MTHLIDKSALVAEIESKKKCVQTLGDNAINSSMQQFYDGMKQSCVEILSFLNTLEVKGVDLTEEIEKCLKQHNMLALGKKDFTNIAKHFFELGIRFNNPITATDRCTAEEIIYYLKRIESDYRIDLTKEIEWLRNQVKKREKYDKRYINE